MPMPKCGSCCRRWIAASLYSTGAFWQTHKTTFHNRKIALCCVPVFVCHVFSSSITCSRQCNHQQLYQHELQSFTEPSIQKTLCCWVPKGILLWPSPGKSWWFFHWFHDPALYIFSWSKCPRLKCLSLTRCYCWCWPFYLSTTGQSKTSVPVIKEKQKEELIIQRHHLAHSFVMVMTPADIVLGSPEYNFAAVHFLFIY